MCNVEGILKTQLVDDMSDRIRWDKLTKDELKSKYGDVIAPALHDFNDYLNLNSNMTSIIDTSFERLINIVHDAARALPRSKFRKHIKPFWNSHLKELKLIKVRAYRLWVSIGRPRDRDNPFFVNYKETKKIFAKALKSIRKKLKK